MPVWDLPGWAEPAKNCGNRPSKNLYTIDPQARVGGSAPNGRSSPATARQPTCPRGELFRRPAQRQYIRNIGKLEFLRHQIEPDQTSEKEQVSPAAIKLPSAGLRAELGVRLEALVVRQAGMGNLSIVNE